MGTARVVKGELHPIEILPVPQDYQYDRRVWAVGHNTSVVASENDSEIRTAALAMYEQPRIMTRDAVKARFAELAKDHFQTLNAIYEEMVAYANHWKLNVLAGNSLKLDPLAFEQCTTDFAGFEDKIKRFACGVAALRADERLLTAFKAMNRVMGKLARGYDAWRLFQLVFIVSVASCTGGATTTRSAVQSRADLSRSGSCSSVRGWEASITTAPKRLPAALFAIQPGFATRSRGLSAFCAPE